MKRQLSLAGILTLVAACSHEGTPPSGTRDGGSGLNAVECKYSASTSDTCDAAVAALESFDLMVDCGRHDVMVGKVAGRHADGRMVTVQVDAIDKHNSKVSVRVEPGDINLAQMVQDKIADKLGMGKLKAAYFVGDSEEAVYEADLETGLSAAERTAKALDWIVIGRELNDVWAQLETRSADSNPARFRIMHVDARARRTKVTFIAGNGTTDSSKTMISRMREEFDRQITADAR